MELLLEHQTQTQIRVTCDGQASHTFDLSPLILSNDEGPPDDVVAYGEALYLALFPLETPARLALDNKPEHILLVATQSDLDAIAWEYLYGPDGFLVLEHHFVRGLPASQRFAPPVLDAGLHIIAVPSNPLSSEVESLDIDGEWLRLKEIIRTVLSGLVLERARPASVEQVRRLVANQSNHIVHFMGHGEQRTTGAILCFEKDNGSLDEVTAKEFTFRVRGTVFLVTLNSCVSARPGSTHFSNLAAALVQHKTPYALGMRFRIRDDDARTFSNAFYSDLANGSPVEEALLQARWTLNNTKRRWVIGVPVLYTSLTIPAGGFTVVPGTPTIKEHQPPLEVTALPRAQGVFQGRNEELQTLGERLTGSERPRILTIHGGGGQGKTALAREVVERFAYAWPDGVWATSLENLPSRATFATDLAQFLGIATHEVLDSNEVERQVQGQLAIRHTLIVLDNAETLIEAVEANDEKAIQLAQFLQQLSSTSVTLLVTSRVQLGWNGEDSYELGGLSPEEGALLFRQSAPQRAAEITQALAEELSEKLDGHPLSLRLLGGAFNASTIALSTFVEDCQKQLLLAKNKFVGQAHRHYKLYACIETSVRYLDKDLRSLLSGLWLFHAPFLPETAIAIFDSESKATEDAPSWVHDRLYTLWQRGLLTRQVIEARDGVLQFYYLLPTTRPYVEQMEQGYDRGLLLKRFGAEYLQIAKFLYDELDKSAVAFVIAQQSRDDFERGKEFVEGTEQGSYLLYWGWVVQRLGNPQHGLELFERALEIAQGQDQDLESSILNNMALVYQTTGQMEQAMSLFQQALPIFREVGDRAGEATILNNMALVYQTTGQMEQAMSLFQQALPIFREVGDRAGEATILNNMAAVYQVTGQMEQAMSLYQQALPIHREVGDRAMEATTLNNMGEVNRAIGQMEQAMSLFQQALPIHREVGNRATEATTLNNMGEVNRAIGQMEQAMSLFQQALPIHREVGNRAMEATTLNNMALVYQATGQMEQAMSLFQQALPIFREVGDRAGEATILNNMAAVYQATRQMEQAMSLFQQALPIHREVGNRAAEATILNNMALVYQATRQMEQAMSLYQQALPIHREVGNRAMEATTLNNMAAVYQATGQPDQALTMFQQCVTLAQQIQYPALEAGGLANIAMVMYQSYSNKDEAIPQMEQALAVLKKTGLPQDATGLTAVQLQNILQLMREGKTLS